MTKAELAKILDVSPGRLSHYFKMGLPWPATVDEAKDWKSEHIQPPGDKTGPKPKESREEEGNSFYEVQFEIPEGDDPEARLARLKAQEQVIGGQISALEKLPMSSKLSIRLKSLRKDHRDVSKLCYAYEQAILGIDEKKKNLVPYAASDEYVRKVLMPVITYIRRLPRMSNNDQERMLLKKVAVTLLNQIVDSGAEAGRIVAITPEQ